MNTYTWSAKDRYGQSVIKEVQANTSAEARDSLLAKGFSELELKEDEVGSIARKGFSKDVQFLGQPVTPSPEALQKARENPTVTVWDLLKKGIGQNGIFLAILALFALYQYYRGNHLSALLLVVAIFLWVAFIIWLGLPSIYYKKLILAADWYRWNEVLSAVGMLKLIGRTSIIKVPASELTRYRAKAFVGNGDLHKGLAEYKQCEGRPDCPSWMYKLFVAGLYTLAKQYDQAIEYNRAAIAENPNSTGWLDLSYRYARYKRNPIKAREALAEADKSPITDVAKPFRARCVGVIAYLEGDYATAKKELDGSIAAIEPLKWRPFKDGHLAIARAYLTCVLARQGDSAGAKNNFALAKEYLVATKEDELLAECQKAVGNA
jgi:tetratricopeptide (TPR) repeat protein